MNPSTSSTTIDTNMAAVSSVPMSVDPESYPFLINILTNLYSNPELTVLQELANNALDSHVLAGQTRPIELTMPSPFNSSFVVKDYGVGMSADELNNIYSNYGKSTKRKNDDQIGGFGLGAKSPLSISSQYSIVSVKDGVKNVVIVAAGDDNVGVVNIIDTSVTDEPNGVEISVPISNISKFNEQSKKFFLGWDAKNILVDGKELTDTIFNNESWVPIAEDGWFSLESRGYSFGRAPHVRVGSVIFEVKDTAVVRHAQSIGISQEMSNRAVVSMKIHEVDLTPAREDIRYTPRTVENIKAAYDRYMVSLIPVFTDKLNAVAERGEALKVYAQIINSGIKIPAKWNDEHITKTYTNTEEKPEIRTITTKDGAKTTSSTNPVELAAYAYKTNAQLFRVAYNDVEDISLVSRNLKDYMKSLGDSSATIIAYSADANIDPWVTVVGNEITVDSVVSAAREYRRARRKAAPRNSSGIATAGVSYAFTDLDNDVFHQKTLVMDIPQNVNYIVEGALNSFESALDNLSIYYRANDAKKRIGSLSVLGINTPLVYIPAKLSVDRFKKFFPESTNLSISIQQKVSEWMDTLSDDVKSVFVNVVSATSSSNDSVNQFCIEIVKSGKANSLLSGKTRNFVESAAGMHDEDSIFSKINSIISSNYSLRFWFLKKYEEFVQVDSVASKFIESYPMLTMNRTHYWSPEILEHAVIYINAVDKK